MSDESTHEPAEPTPLKPSSTVTPTRRVRLLRMVTTNPVRRRLLTAAAGYMVVLVFVIAVGVTRIMSPGLPSTLTLIIAGVLAAPVALAFIYDRLTGLKTPWFELTLSAVTVDVRETLSAAIQQADSSATPALVQYISTAIAQGPADIVEVNLRREPWYWWSTRLYLLAALLADYTSTRQLVFVTGSAERCYIGMATPVGVRRSLAAQFPNYEKTYTRLRATLSPKLTPEQVNDIVTQWPSSLQAVTQNVEATIKELVSPDALVDWLRATLDTAILTWDGGPDDSQLRYRILDRGSEYVALVYQGRLDRLVSREALAVAIARETLRRQVA
ncbi:MAG: hypothetical protein M3072_07705 [Candidatus Dormibacteraeota bacterium]|nr:hypothetical protein [Candidatus Dormibacteraeota bacterium]